MKKVIIIFSTLSLLADLHAVEIGDTKALVLSELGKPQSSIQSPSREILNFEREIIQLKNGVVEKISFRPVRVASAEEGKENHTSTPRKVERMRQSYVASPYSGIVVVPGEIKLHPLVTQK